MMQFDDTLLEAVNVFISIAESSKGLPAEYQYYLIKAIEAQYETEADTELGEFLNLFVYLLWEWGVQGAQDDYDIQQDIQDLIDVSDLNEDMLVLVGNQIQGMINPLLTC